MSSKTVDPNELLKNAAAEGDLSAQSLQVLTGNLNVGAQIQAGLGVAAEDVQSSEVVLVTMMVDDSSSIRFVSGNTQMVRDGHNEVIGALKASKQKEGILAHTRYLNGHVLYPYRKLDEAILMDQQNYDPNGGTPLYDQAVVLLGTVLAKSKEFQDCGVPVRTITLIVTDGADEHSRGGPQEIRSLVEDLLRKEVHILAAMGVEDGHTNFKSVFKDMGIRDEWILLPGNSPTEIRKAFQVFSQSAVRASQNAASFSKTALGGFGS